MPVDTEQLRSRLREFDFTGAMVEVLGWNFHNANPLLVDIDGQDYVLNAVAEKSGQVVYSCQSKEDNQMPPYPVRQKIERQVAKTTFEHLIIFHDVNRTTQYWQWVRRKAGKTAAWREQVYRPNQTEEPLIQKLQQIAFDLEEEDGLNISIVTGRVEGAFDVDRVTKRFYDRFKSEHDALLSFIEGIDSVVDREWYASLMLNRLMFVYFIQKKGFLVLIVLHFNIGILIPCFFAIDCAFSYPASACLTIPIPGSVVRTCTSLASLSSVPSATTTIPAWIARPIPTPPP